MVSQRGLKDDAGIEQRPEWLGIVFSRSAGFWDP